MVQKRLLVFPNQLFRQHPGFASQPDEVVLIEDSLFFGDERYPMNFHKQKLWLHRASMKRYERFLHELGFQTRYIEFQRSLPIHQLLQQAALLSDGDACQYITCEPNDFMLEKRLNRFAEASGCKIELLSSPLFINQKEINDQYRDGKKRWFMADYYKFQRRRLNVLMEGDEPVGGRWSFDADNRKKVPKTLLAEIPTLPVRRPDDIEESARDYIEKNFSTNPGSIETLFYPTSHKGATDWLSRFLSQRFERFGDFEDAIVQNESWLWHSVLTPMLNVGLLTPQQVVDRTCKYADSHDVPLNSLEGFLRQVIGWREFMRATYDDLGVAMRTTNYWNHQRSIPDSFWSGTTGILPLDDTIHRILKTGYCHHIERLMVLGGFMFLCEFHPDEIYRWFMEMFVDSYDWVMVPNAYAMSQNADGGLITTKPYFSGSSYIRKMSNYQKSNWCDVWDGLYWRWIWMHSEDLARNPRWAMMCSTVKKMNVDKRNQHLQAAESFLDSI